MEGLAKGESLQGKRIVIVEDVTTTGGSAMKAVEAVRDAGGDIALVFTMVDREEGATETFAEAGIEFRSLYKAGEFLKGEFLDLVQRLVCTPSPSCPGLARARRGEIEGSSHRISFRPSPMVTARLPSPH